MKYKIDSNIYEVERYFFDEKAYFQGYENCSLTQGFLKHGLIYEEHLYNIYYKYLNKNSIVVEGGSFIGDQSVFLSKISNTLYTFEPLKKTFNLLLKNLELNGCDNVLAFNKGLSDKIGTVSFHHIPTGNLGGTSLNENTMPDMDFPEIREDDQDVAEIITIDSLSLDKLDFIKLDIEGYEPKALMGGIETIRKWKPVLLIESYCNHQGGYSLEYVKNKFDFLIDIGYQVKNCGGPNWIFKKI